MKFLAELSKKNAFDYCFKTYKFLTSQLFYKRPNLLSIFKTILLILTETYLILKTVLP